MENLLVVGSGLMGGGIALASAKAGYKVIVVERSREDLERGFALMEKTLASMIKKGTWTKEEADEAWDNLHGSIHLEDGKHVDLVIEAVPEKLSLKQDIFRKLDRLINKEAIFATNTSSLSIAAIAEVTERPDRVVGMHFFSPVPIMKLLELVSSLSTSEDTMNKIQSVGDRLGKKTIIAKDYPGFIVNRLLLPMLNEAAFLIMEGNAPEEIDRGMLLGANHPLGPLKLADYIGLDVLLFTMESLYEGFNDPKYRPCPLLKRMVEAGWLGKKAGRGFYIY
ncbi:3-hydroxyacyl-CoA dehydrogenase NAD-binding domain-containing protein [Priestia megaterium]|uniref:3-hydroxyacyl-CoA dehydrogenase family protein n=1 Tax=Priestia megaterium TaxID=1404 RepID=UPI0021609A52|nr:3-hydroxyacyl-CoA dehydrogenase NAD-binding domain-containing protein [Priestia megaterium]MCR8929742.1 3-hydroxyacyl-CoA dehydrogenase NAD-binding domain-containing protein [Priestia megaterium]